VAGGEGGGRKTLDEEPRNTHWLSMLIFKFTDVIRVQAGLRQLLQIEL
jgi:hypothetical protein